LIGCGGGYEEAVLVASSEAADNARTSDSAMNEGDQVCASPEGNQAVAICECREDTDSVKLLGRRTSKSVLSRRQLGWTDSLEFSNIARTAMLAVCSGVFVRLSKWCTESIVPVQEREGETAVYAVEEGRSWVMCE
jgi:hypothetical protein